METDVIKRKIFSLINIELVGFFIECAPLRSMHPAIQFHWFFFVVSIYKSTSSSLEDVTLFLWYVILLTQSPLERKFDTAKQMKTNRQFEDEWDELTTGYGSTGEWETQSVNDVKILKHRKMRRLSEKKASWKENRASKKFW